MDEEMEMERLQALRGAALEFANALRARDNAPAATELMPGERQDCATCPIARTASEGCERGSWFVGPAHAMRLGPRGGEGEVVLIPLAVCEFMLAFDRGAYPDLIVPSAMDRIRALHTATDRVGVAASIRGAVAGHRSRELA